MPRIGNEPQSRPIELPQAEQIETTHSQEQISDAPELERTARSSSGGSAQAAESLIAAQTQQAQLQRQLLESRANAIHQACAGLGTNEEAVFRNLTGLSLDERKQLDGIYKEKFGMTLEEQVRDEMSGVELDRALGILNGGKSTIQEAERTQRSDKEIVLNGPVEEQLPE